MNEEKTEEPQANKPAAPERESIPYELVSEMRMLAENAGHALMCTPAELSDARRKAARFYDKRRADLFATEFKKPEPERDQAVLRMPKQCPDELLDEYSGLFLAGKAHRLAKGFVLRRVGIMQSLFAPPPERGAGVPQDPHPSDPAPEIAQAVESTTEVSAEA